MREALQLQGRAATMHADDRIAMADADTDVRLQVRQRFAFQVKLLVACNKRLDDAGTDGLASNDRVQVVCVHRVATCVRVASAMRDQRMSVANEIVAVYPARQRCVVVRRRILVFSKVDMRAAERAVKRRVPCVYQRVMAGAKINPVVTEATMNIAADMTATVAPASVAEALGVAIATTIYVVAVVVVAARKCCATHQKFSLKCRFEQSNSAMSMSPSVVSVAVSPHRHAASGSGTNI
jgi:hypothetical protein